jgi:hypothetical protein
VNPLGRVALKEKERRKKRARLGLCGRNLNPNLNLEEIILKTPQIGFQGFLNQAISQSPKFED